MKILIFFFRILDFLTKQVLGCLHNNVLGILWFALYPPYIVLTLKIHILYHTVFYLVNFLLFKNNQNNGMFST